MVDETSLMVNIESSALILIDIQERLAGAMPKSVRERVIEQVNVLVTAANTLSVPIIVTEQYPKGLGHTEEDIKVRLIEETPIVEKTNFSCVKAEVFFSSIDTSRRKQIILAGMETHICVLQTAIDLQQHGYQVFVVEDAVSSREKFNQYNALQRLRHAGVVITNVESVLFEWLGDAKHPEFKALAKLIV